MKVGDKVCFIVNEASLTGFPYAVVEGIVCSIYPQEEREDMIIVKTRTGPTSLRYRTLPPADRVFPSKEAAIRWLLKEVNDWRNDCYDMLEQNWQSEFEKQ